MTKVILRSLGLCLSCWGSAGRTRVLYVHGADWQGLKQPYQEELTPSMKAIRAGCHHDIRLDDGSEHGIAE